MVNPFFILMLLNEEEKKMFVQIRTRKDLEEFAELLLLEKKKRMLQNSIEIVDGKEKNWVDRITIEDERQKKEKKGEKK